MKIIEEYRRLTEEIAVCESRIESIERELSKQSDCYKPKNVKGIDYEEERVQTSSCMQSIIETYDIIVNLNYSLSELYNEFEVLVMQRSKLEDIIDSLGDMQKKAVMMKISRKSIEDILDATGYCERHVYRLTSKLNKCRM